jgi:hypothetical protein
MVDLPSTQLALPPEQPRPKPKPKPKAKPKPKRKDKKRAEARARGRARRIAERRKFFLDLKRLPDDACLTLREWAILNNLSERQGRRILNGGDGPTVTMLSTQKKGVTVRENRRWQESRSRRSP